jgi:general secretion pathway protein G
MFRCVPPVWSCGERGLTLVELLVTLVILSILAAAALPYAEVTVRREKEMELRRSLRDIRTAIDIFREDWLAGRISKTNNMASDDGYPKTLQVLVEGVDTGEAKDRKRKYLRRVPRDPFASPLKPPVDQWMLRGYQDAADSSIWSGRDVYDVHSMSGETAIDGTRYSDW